MKQKIQSIMLALVATMSAGLVAAAPVGAINVFGGCKADASAAVCKAQNDTVNSPIQTLISTLLFVIGVVAVVMIIVGGIRYVLSNGDASQVTSAKNTILYAVVGLIVAMLAYAIVNFVVAQF